MKRTSIFFIFLKIFCVTFCFSFFIYLMNDVWDKFSNKFTSTGMRLNEKEFEEKYLPCITVCPWKAFKNKGFYYNFQDFLNNTFEQIELIPNIASGIYNITSFHIEAISSIYLGRCYMMCYLLKVKKNDKINILLTKHMDVTGSWESSQNYLYSK